VYDLTSFVPEHPGSSETLLDHSGGDATVIFDEVGHSSIARVIKDAYFVIQPEFLKNSLRRAAHSSFLVAGDDGDRSRSGSLVSTSSDTQSNTGREGSSNQGSLFLPGDSSLFSRRMVQERRAVKHIATSTLRVISPQQETRLTLTAVISATTGEQILSPQSPSAIQIDEEGVLKCHEDALRGGESGREDWVGLLWSPAMHPGQAREFYDPIAQEWWVWWSCCGCGRIVNREAVYSAMKNQWE
jgi:hypothetical protein